MTSLNTMPIIGFEINTKIPCEKRSNTVPKTIPYENPFRRLSNRQPIRDGMRQIYMANKNSREPEHKMLGFVGILYYLGSLLVSFLVSIGLVQFLQSFFTSASFLAFAQFSSFLLVAFISLDLVRTKVPYTEA